MEEEVYILNDEQVQWFENRYTQTQLPQVVVTKIGVHRCIEKKYLEIGKHDDIISYIAEQNIAVSMLIVEPSVSNVKE